MRFPAGGILILSVKRIGCVRLGPGRKRLVSPGIASLTPQPNRMNEGEGRPREEISNKRHEGYGHPVPIDRRLTRAGWFKLLTNDFLR